MIMDHGIIVSIMALRVALYVPNLLCYARIILAFVGLYISSTLPVRAVTIWIVSASLDLFDGIIARWLGQTSRFGVFLDIAADNILRTCVWIAAASSSKEDTDLLLAAGFICLEWLTMLSTQLQATNSDGTHWKTNAPRLVDHGIVRAVFRNNFRNPMGTLCIFGLFSANLFLYGSYHDVLYKQIPWFNYLRVVAFIGRVCSAGIELAFCLQHLRYMLDQDAHTKED
jgi:phosphatidylglycerophosphate synthase